MKYIFFKEALKDTIKILYCGFVNEFLHVAWYFYFGVRGLDSNEIERSRQIVKRHIWRLIKWLKR